MGKMNELPTGVALSVVLLWYVWSQITHCLSVEPCYQPPAQFSMGCSSGRRLGVCVNVHSHSPESCEELLREYRGTLLQLTTNIWVACISH